MNAKPPERPKPPAPPAEPAPKPKKAQGTPGMTRDRVRRLLLQHPDGIGAAKIADGAGLDRKSVSYHLKKLGAEMIGTGPNIVWRLPANAPAPEAPTAPARSGPTKGTRAARKGSAASAAGVVTTGTPATEPTVGEALAAPSSPPAPQAPLGGPSFGDVLRVLTALEAGDVAAVRRFLVAELGRVA